MRPCIFAFFHLCTGLCESTSARTLQAALRTVALCPAVPFAQINAWKSICCKWAAGRAATNKIQPKNRVTLQSSNPKGPLDHLRPSSKIRVPQMGWSCWPFQFHSRFPTWASECWVPAVQNHSSCSHRYTIRYSHSSRGFERYHGCLGARLCCSGASNIDRLYGYTVW